MPRPDGLGFEAFTILSARVKVDRHRVMAHAEHPLPAWARSLAGVHRGVLKAHQPASARDKDLGRLVGHDRTRRQL